MSFKIKLTDTSANARRQTGDVDVVESALELTNAVESLNIASIEYDVLVTAIENIEAGVEMSEAIAAKGNEADGVAVARESLRQSLRMIGQEPLVDQVVTAGTESITAANEGIGDLAKKAWEKTKEFVRKIWDFIVSLMNKAIHFFMSLIGKGATTSDRLKKLIKSLKDSKRKELDGAEFNESQRKAINKKFALLATDDAVNGSGIVEHIGIIRTIFNAVSNGKDSLISSVIGDNAGLSNVDRILNGINNVTDLQDVVALLDDNKDLLATNLDITDKTAIAAGGVTLSNSESSYIISEFEDMVDSSAFRIVIVGFSFDKLHCVGLYKTDDYSEKETEYDRAYRDADSKGANVTASDVRKLINKAISLQNCFKVKAFALDIDEDTYDENEKNVYPLTFDDLEEIRDTLKDAGSDVKTKLEKFDKAINREAKELKNTLKTVSETAKNAANDDGVESLIPQLRTISKNVISLETKVAKATAQGVVDMAKAITAGPIYDYAEQSSKLYKKD